MAQSKRSPRAFSGGKLALFEVIQAAQTQGDGQLSDAVAPLVQASTQRESPPEPAPPPPPASTRPILVTRQVPTPDVPVRPSTARRQPQRGGVSALGFTTACAGLIAVIGAGFVAFQHFANDKPQVVNGSQPMPEVLDVGKPGQIIAARPRNDLETRVQSQIGSPVALPTDFRRTAGLNYVLVQSYDPSEEAQANATRDALLANGIGATVESGIYGWGKRLAVVGVEGFENYKTNPQYKTYIQRLETVERKVTSENRKIRKFDPTPVQWRT